MFHCVYIINKCHLAVDFITSNKTHRFMPPPENIIRFDSMCCSIFPLRTISLHPLMGQYWTTPGHCRVCDGRRYLDKNVYLHYYLVIITCKTGFPLYDNQLCYCSILELVS